MNSASDHEVRRIAEGTGDIIVSVDRAGTITYASPAIRTFGYAPEDLVGQTGLAFVHPKDRGRFAENTAALLRGETGELLGFVNALRDVTARRQAEAALRESEARFKLIAESSPDIILQTDRRGRMVFVSPAVRAYGYEPADLLGREQAEFVHADDLAQVTANQRQTLQDEVVEDPGRRANRYRTGGGRGVWLEGNPRALHDDGGEVIGTVNVLRDVTTRRAQSDLFETAFVHAPSAKGRAGLDGRFLRVNAAFARMLGYTATELLGLDFQTLTHPDDLDTDLALLGQLIGGEIESYTLDKRYVRKDGALVWG